MATKDSRNIFERVYGGMRIALCNEGTLQERMVSASLVVLPLLREDFPAAMRDSFVTWRQKVAAAQELGATDADWKRLAEDYLKLYTQAARLDGVRQETIGDLQ